MSEREELEQAIAALEGQRAALGDAVVDASLGALREKLASLEAAGHSDRQRKQVTILFMDVAGSTAIVCDLDPEDNLAIMDTALHRLATPVAQAGGRVTRYMGDGFMALFGHPVASEHDPDNAVRAGLAILNQACDYAQELEARWGVAEFNVRIGIDTGVVVIGGESEAENTVAGAAVNLAARLESAAQPGTVLISHNTYQHVRGVFDLQPLQPIQAKGFAEPVPIYQVLRAKERSFRTRRRGVEGIETRLIGRASELKALQDAHDLVLTNSERQMVTVVGEAGLGKSRLLYEFENWVDLQPTIVTLFRGRARQETERQPYSLFRDLFAFRFGVQDDDPAEIVSAKFVEGFLQVLGDSSGGLGQEHGLIEMQAHFAGHLLGFGFNTSPHVQPLTGDSQQLRDRALNYLAGYFKAASALTPILLLLEDLHWADDSSLDTLNRLAMALREEAVLIVSATRPDLFQRRPHWMEGQPFHSRLDLHPLSHSDSRLLTREVLQRIADLPDALRDLIVSKAEGNPFFVEELVKLLIEEDVIVKAEPAWRVVQERLAGLRVPPTLTGVLQARLDSLSQSERTVLQRASVVGRVFWEQTVAYLNREGEGPLDDETVTGKLLTLREKELVFRRDMSAFADATEYIFKHALLRDVAYESVLKPARRDYHALAAEWLIQRSGEPAASLSGLIADHLERAGKDREALGYLLRAGRDASERYAHEEAAGYFDRALALLDEGDLETRFQLLLDQELAYASLGKRDPQRQVLEALENAVHQIGDAGRRAKVAIRLAVFLSHVSDYVSAIAAAQRAALLAEEARDFGVCSDAHRTWGFILLNQGRYQEAKARCETALALARKAEDPEREGLAFNNLGNVYLNLGELNAAREYLERAAALARQTGNMRNEALALNNLGNVFSGWGDYESTRSTYEQVLTIARSIGDRYGETLALVNVGWVDAMLGRYVEARHSLLEALSIALGIGHRQLEAYIIINLALVAVNLSEFEAARSHAEQALEIGRAIGERSAEAYGFTYLAHASLALGDAAAAEDAYGQAVSIRRELEQHHLAMEPLAGLAQVAMKTGDESAALLRVEEILNYLDNGGTLDGTDEPLRVYWICYQVLNAVQDPRAIQVLTTAYALVQERGAKITDEATERGFLENVPWHREIAAAAQIHHL